MMEMFDLNNSHSVLSSVENLYNSQQKVFLKSKKGDEKTRILRITVELKSGLAISVGKVLSLQITDDNDCTFFFSLLLTQEDFSILKCQQGLLVDFDHFPSQLAKLLEACNSQEFNKFILVLDEEDVFGSSASKENVSGRGFVFLKVIETNNFKNLCHLSLKVAQGSEADIRQHMSAKISWLKERLAEEERRCRAAEAQLSEAVRTAEVRARELAEVQVRAAEERSNLRAELGREVAEERERAARGEREYRERVEVEKVLMERQLGKQISDLSEQIASLTFDNKNLCEAKCQLETAVKEKMFLLEAMEKQNAQLTQEVNLLKKQNGQLDADYHEKDKAVVGLRTRLAVLEQELKDKGKLLDKQQELLQAASEQKTFLEEALADKDAALQRKIAAFQTLSSDLMKSNEIIAKLQTDLAANKAKMKLRTDIALEQEKILEKKSQQMAAQEEIIKDLEAKVAKLMEELNSTKAQLEETNKQMQEKEMVIKKNENVISWLNRRLTESTSGLSSGAPSCLLTSGRSVAESAFGGPQSKGPISSLAKGWPSWLVHSVAGSNGSSQGDCMGISNTANEMVKLSSNSIPVEVLQNQSKTKTQKSSESSAINTTDPKAEGKNENKPRGLDPKYFQSCTDKDYIPNLQVTKGGAGAAQSVSCSSKPSAGKQPPSAYFPKKPVPL